MSRSLDIADADSFAAATNVSRETIRRLNLYESALREWQPRINLVANATLSQVWHRHFYDSWQLLPLLPQGAKSLVDLGSGGGFPGMVLAIVLAEPGAAKGMADGSGGALGEPGGDAGIARVTLVESDRRKCAFLREVARRTGVPVEILSTRIENPETQIKLGQVDVVTARALAPLERLLGLAFPLFGEQTVGLFLKGQGAAAEVQAARAVWAFDADVAASVTSADAGVVVVRNLRRR